MQLVVSDDQRGPLAWANWAGTVLHGMRTDLYPFQATPEGHLLFLGRISPEKGPERAISMANTWLASLSRWAPVW